MARERRRRRLRDLARDRAAAVATLFRERHGIQSDRITVGGSNGEPCEGRHLS